MLKDRRGFAHILVLLLLLAGIAVSAYLVQQKTNFFPKAASLSIQETIINQEKKVAGRDVNGNLNEAKKAKFLATINPQGFKSFLKKDLAEQQAKLKVTENRRSMTSSSISEAVISTTDISSCGDIISGGDYYLTQDITGENRCIYIHNTQNVNLDCQNHSINVIYNPDLHIATKAALDIENVQNFSIKNCYIGSVLYSSLSILNSSSGTIQSNTIKEGDIFSEKNTNIEIFNNTINTIFAQLESSFIKIHDNKFTNKIGKWVGSVVNLGFGDNNTVENNAVDGGWTGDTDTESGADDGIFLNSESEDLILGNSVSNNYDCGIETGSFLKNSKVSNNKINNSGLCGIGGWYGITWLNNTFDSNTVDGSAYMFYVFLSDIRLPPGEQFVYFKDNTFINNIFLKQRPSSYLGPTEQYSSLIDFQNLPPGTSPSIVQTGNNVFKDNDFGQTIGSPVIIPISMIVDQGGNKCLAGNVIDPLRPLKCISPNTVRITTDKFTSSAGQKRR